MKINRKTVLSTAAVLGVAALVAGGTIAYFTDHETATNSFTVGKVDITLYESQLHRMNSGRTGAFAASASDSDYCDWINVHAATGSTIDSNTGAGPQNGNYDSAKYCTPGMDAYQTTGLSAVENGHITARSWGYSDSTIIADAASYKAGADTSDTADDGYFTRVSQNIVPGQWVRKFAYVKNDGSNDAYILIRYMIPESYANNVTLKVPSTPYTDGNDHYFTAVTKASGSYVATTPGTYYNETIGTTTYRIYAAVTTDVVKPGEMTFWSPVNTIKLNDAEVQTKDATTGAVSYPQEQIDVKVDAQAIQAKTFADAITAINTGALD